MNTRWRISCTIKGLPVLETLVVASLPEDLPPEGAFRSLARYSDVYWSDHYFTMATTLFT